MKKKADHIGLERWLRSKEHRPVKRESYKGMDIYLSEGGPYFYNERLKEYPLGWFESAYAIGENDKVFCIQVLEFDKLHDKNMTELARQRARVASAREAARFFVDKCMEEKYGQTHN